MIGGVLLDLDGTLYVGDTAVPGAAGALTRLRAAGLPFRLVTNTTSRSRAMLAERLGRLGIAASTEEILSAPVAAAALARERGHTVIAPFLPEPALEDLDGLTLTGGITGRSAGRPTAVLLGDLGERWSYALLQEAFEYVMDGAELLTCSRDRYFRQGGGLALDAGPFVAALEYATSTQAVVAGKPSGAYFRAAVQALGGGIRPESVAMVGDDLRSDVEGAQAAGLQGWLVRTGKFREDELAAGSVVPDRVLATVAELPAAVILSP
jgi:HAD superfamily hydrolase (TIGR01458 family)